VWARVDPLPLGIARAGTDWGDAVKLDFGEPSWSSGGPSLVDTATGDALQQNGAYGSAMPAPFGFADAGIDASVMRDGRPVRLTLVAHPDNPDLSDDPTSVVIRYAHRDAFILKTELVCGGHGKLVPQALYDSWTGRDLLTGLPIQP
jgi:hypothetical protein